MKGSHQIGGFQDRSSSVLSGPISEVEGIFSNRDWLSTSGKEPSATTMVYKIVGVSWTLSTNNSKGDFSCLILGFLLDILWLLGGILSSNVDKFHLKFKCMWIHRLFQNYFFVLNNLTDHGSEDFEHHMTTIAISPSSLLKMLTLLPSPD